MTDVTFVMCNFRSRYLQDGAEYDEYGNRKRYGSPGNVAAAAVSSRRSEQQPEPAAPPPRRAASYKYPQTVISYFFHSTT